MTQQQSKIFPPEKTDLHPRNKHRFRYDFKQLIESSKELAPFVSVNKYGNESIDFFNPDAVKTLNKALLKYFYSIETWDIPENYLCPPIPGRADYIHYIADLLGSCNDGIIPKGKGISVLDIGVGANCIYPIIGVKEYGWNFVGSDIDTTAIRSANKIIDSNPSIKDSIECRLQKSSTNIFNGIIKTSDFFDFTICNPPFHSSAKDAMEGTQRKLKNLGSKKQKTTVLNFGGQNNELWCEGGEKTFVQKMIQESSRYSTSCFWFSSLISKSNNLPSIYSELKNANAFEIKTIDMAQGQKISRIVAWTFLDKNQQKTWKLKRWK